MIFGHPSCIDVFPCNLTRFCYITTLPGPAFPNALASEGIEGLDVRDGTYRFQATGAGAADNIFLVMYYFL